MINMHTKFEVSTYLKPFQRYLSGD